jgi:hypothetical protein
MSQLNASCFSCGVIDLAGTIRLCALGWNLARCVTRRLFEVEHEEERTQFANSTDIEGSCCPLALGSTR